MGKVLVTGGAGFIGSHLVDALLDAGEQVLVVDDLSTGDRTNLRREAEFIQGDIADPKLIKFLAKDIDRCFHLAAIASVERANREWLQTHRINAGGIVNLFQAIAAGERTIPVVYASSAAVYGNNSGDCNSEDDIPHPISAYGADKLACELHGEVAARIHKIPNAGLRFFNVFGQRQNSSSPYSGVISAFGHRIAAGYPITIFGDGYQSRDFVFVKDAVKALIMASCALQTGKITSGVFNVCTGQGVRIKDLPEMIGDIVRRRPQIEYAPARAGDIQQSLGSPQKARLQLNYAAEFSAKQGLELMFNSM
ncbi:MAG: NAD-dependent epimerase/dehydratase family protein [Alphaproteobacteria bacterium]|nr:MAG: NAD-dependent epimerase/dehydratase family protein [Alphaproteobacteria bacterium]